jgi:hypothetical protein
MARFDGRIHLYHAEFALWDVDYLGQYKGSGDQEPKPATEGPEPPRGLRYHRVRYTDTTGNGFLDRIEYLTAEYGNEANQRVDRVVSLLDYADAECLQPDVGDLIDPRVDVPLTGWRLDKWNGQPLTVRDFAGTACKAIYDKMRALYAKVADTMWANAWRLYETARQLGLNRSEQLDRDLRMSYTKAELAQIKTIEVPKGYSRHLTGRDRREKYHNGYWLREKVFSDILAYSNLDRFTLEKFYYTARYDRLCAYLEANYK